MSAFKGALRDQYANSMLDFTADRLSVFPCRDDLIEQYAAARTPVLKDDDSTIAVRYSLRRTKQGWKVSDFSIDDINYLKSLRDDYAAEIDQQVLGHLISRLQAQ